MRRLKNRILCFMLSVMMAMQGLPMAVTASEVDTEIVEELVDEESTEEQTEDEDDSVDEQNESVIADETEEQTESEETASEEADDIAEVAEEALEAVVEESDVDIIEEDFQPGATGYVAFEGDDIVADSSIYPKDYHAVKPYAVDYLPASYRTDERFLPNLRNQNPYGTCWAHASMAMAEIGRMKKNGASEVDYSEAHLAYFTYNTPVDPLGGMNGDSNSYVGPKKLFDAGGNYYSAGFTLASWYGVAQESSVPYSQAASIISNGLEEYLAHESVEKLQYHYIIDIKNNPDEVKKMIQENGAVGINYHSPEDGEYDGYSSVYNSYYCPNAVGTNHAVTIVGWDDNFSKNNFKTMPEGDGAWLVRNSWRTGGKYEQESRYGYFWLSYYDKSLGADSHVFIFSDDDNYENNYQYDGSFARGTSDVGESFKMANVFTAQGNESIGEVGFYTSNANVYYTIDIYKGVSDGNPENGTKIATKTGITHYAGYYTVPLANSVAVSANEKFSVVVGISKPGAEKLLVDLEASNPSGDHPSVAAIQPGQSYIKTGSSWRDFYQYFREPVGNLRIKAFTSNIDTVEPTSIAFRDNLSENGKTIGIGKSFKAALELTPSNANESLVSWKSANDNIATVSDKGIVTGVATGNTTITAYYGGSVSASFAVNVIDIPVSFYINTDNLQPYYYFGQEYQFSVKTDEAGYDMSSYPVKWSSSDKSVATVDNSGKVVIVGVGDCTIEAEIGGSVTTKSIRCRADTPSVKIDISDDNVITLSWEAVNGATSYMITKPGDTEYSSEGIVYSAEKGVYEYKDYTYQGTTEKRILSYSVASVAVNGNTTYGLATTVTVTLGQHYKITYHLGNGTNNPNNPSSFIENGYVRLYLPTPPQGYKFVGWYKDAAYTQQAPASFYGGTSNMDLYAKYNPISYKIKYFRNDGTTTSQLDTYYYDEFSSFRTPDSRAGYQFVSWNTEENGSGTVYNAGASFKNLTATDGEVISLYAQWTINKYTVAFNSNGGTIVPNQIVEYGGKVEEPIEPTKEGYIFAGWYSNSTLTKAWSFDSNTVSRNITLYAKWEITQNTVTFKLNNGKADVTQKVNYNETVTKPADPSREGYEFKGWYKDIACTAEWDFANDKVTAPLTLYAKWEQILIGAPVIEAQSKSMLIEDGKYLIDAGTMVSISIAGGSEGSRIYYTTDGSEPTDKSIPFTEAFAVNEDMVVKAIVYSGSLKGEETSKSFVIAFNEFAISHGNIELVKGDSYTISATLFPTTKSADDIIWYSDDENVATVENGAVNAVAVGSTTVHAKINDWRGREIIADCTVEVEAKTFVVRFYGFNNLLLAEEKIVENGSAEAPEVPGVKGYIFVRWDKEYSNIQTNLDVYAVYELETYSICFEANGGTIPVETKLTYNYEDEDIVLPEATDKLGYIFAGWYDNAEFEGQAITIIPKNSTGDRAFYARWKNEKELWMKWEGLDYGQKLEVEYEGKALKPAYEVYFGDTKLVLGKDYTAAYANNINVNTSGIEDRNAKIIITGRGNYTGRVTEYFTIVPKSIEDIDVDIVPVALNYSGRIQKKAPVVTWNGKAVAAKFLTVTYTDETEGAYMNEGAYEVSVTGKDNFKGTRNTTLQIVKTNAKDASAPILMSRCRATITPFTYDGSVIDFSDEAALSHLTVAMGTKKLVCGTDYEVKCGIEYNGIPCQEIGTYTAVIRGINQYYGELRVKFRIDGVNIVTAKFAAIPNAIYDGTAQKPALSVTDKKGTPLSEGTDYSVVYDFNVSPGVAKVYVTGIGSYFGKVTKTFRITALPVTDLGSDVIDISFKAGSDSFAYEKAGVKPALEVKFTDANGTVQPLKEGTDFVVAYRYNTTIIPVNGRLPEATVTFRKNFSGKKTVNFSIKKASISELTIYVPDMVENVRAGVFMSNPVITDKNDRVLTKRTDYDVALVYRNESGRIVDKSYRPVAGEKLSVTVKGVNNYEGELTGDFRIFAKGMTVASARVTIRPEAAANIVYTGLPVRITEGDLKVVVGKTELSTTDYRIIQSSYTNNTNKGTAKVTIEGIGDYAGRKTVSFVIKPKPMSWWEKLSTYSYQIFNR